MADAAVAQQERMARMAREEETLREIRE